MSIYRRDEVLPEWEPAPWPMEDEAANRQERGFHERALKSIEWQAIPWKDFPAEGMFGQQKDWFSSADVEFFASIDGENMLLIRNVWFGFPDPPEWGLASRPADQTDSEWLRWGYFPDLPKTWVLPTT